MANLRNIHWTRDALCKDLDLRLFSSYDPKNVIKAKLVCKDCTVQKECLAFSHDINCVSAGTSRYDRLVLLWRRVNSERQSNWKQSESVLPKIFK